MNLADFIDEVERDRPGKLTAVEVASVTPNPWVERRGSGGGTRIWMRLGNVWYEREQGGDIWYRSDLRSSFDVLDAA